jgi:hypothetical protein
MAGRVSDENLADRESGENLKEDKMNGYEGSKSFCSNSNTRKVPGHFYLCK